MLGSLIFHGLNLLTHCGGGAYGDVHYCEDISGKKMAVKIVSKKKLGDSWNGNFVALSTTVRLLKMRRDCCRYSMWKKTRRVSSIPWNRQILPVMRNTFRTHLLAACNLDHYHKRTCCVFFPEYLTALS